MSNVPEVIQQDAELGFPIDLILFPNSFLYIMLFP